MLLQDRTAAEVQALLAVLWKPVQGQHSMNAV